MIRVLALCLLSTLATLQHFPAKATEQVAVIGLGEQVSLRLGPVLSTASMQPGPGDDILFVLTVRDAEDESFTARVRMRDGQAHTVIVHEDDSGTASSEPFRISALRRGGELVVTGSGPDRPVGLARTE